MSRKPKSGNGKTLLKAAAGIVVVIGAALFVKTSIQLYQERQVYEAQIAANTGNAVQQGSGQAIQESQPVSTPFSGSVNWVEEDWMPEMPKEEDKDGQSYELNPNIRTVLFMGVDKQGSFESSYIASNGGQSDGIFLFIQDVTTKEFKILMIPRDTMTPIRLYDLAGNYVGQGVRNLTLAFAYGTSPDKSCENTAYAVSQLLGGIPITQYLAVTASALPVLNDAVGGVTVTINEPGMAERDPSLQMGATVTLKGDQAETYLRYRDVTQANTAVSRMSRHREYMKAWMEKAKTAAASDDSFGADLMDSIKNVMVTNMAKDQYLNLGMEILQSGETLNDETMLMLPGEAAAGTYYDEYYPDQEAIDDLVLELFYRPAE